MRWQLRCRIARGAAKRSAYEYCNKYTYSPIPQLLSSIAISQAALVLVTPALIKSEHVRRVELPARLVRSREPASGFNLFWVLLEPYDWKAAMPELAEVQAIGDPNRPLSHSQSSADEQVLLIQVVANGARALGQLAR